MNKFRLISLFTLLVLLLTACPGGGGGGAGTITNVKSTAGAGNIVVTWKYDAAKESEINAFAILRNPNASNAASLGVITKTVAKNLRTYTDSTAVQGTSYTYSVAIVDKNGVVQDSAAVKQSNGPIKPGPTGGNVTVSLAANPTTLAPGETTTLTATVTGATSVEFFQDDVSIGTDNAAPFEKVVTLADAGSYDFTAKAGTVTSDPVTVTVNDAGDLAPDGTYKTLAGVKLEAGTTATGTAVKAAGLAVGGSAGGATGATKGTVDLNTDGSFTYTPNAGATGADSFTYTVGTDTGTVTINIEAQHSRTSYQHYGANAAAAGRYYCFDCANL